MSIYQKQIITIIQINSFYSFFFEGKKFLKLYNIIGDIINYIDKKMSNGKNKLLIYLKNKKYIKKELIESDYILSNINGTSLDKEQRIAIITDEVSTLVIAGAGSGKSLTIVGKIRYLIERKKINPNSILCISFTKEASLSLETKIKKIYNYNIKVYTFHSLAMKILKEKKYNIFNPNLLNYVVDEYFFMIENNRTMKVAVKKVLNKIDTPYDCILKSDNLIKLKKLIITFINLFKTNNYKVDYFLKINENKELIRIIFDIYYLYEEELKSTNSLDFNDMIIMATGHVKDSNVENYKYIIVDEYQDTSYIRYLFLNEIIKKTGAKIMCVGDDYQSIYRFNGCCIDMFLNYKKYYKNAKILKINNTYRNCQELINVAGNFIMKNERQIFKKLKSKKRIKKPIKIYYGNTLFKILDIVVCKYDNIAVLGRNNFDILKYFDVIKGIFIYKNKEIKYLTIHSSKGLEFDVVILINLEDSINGLPSKIKNEKILKYVNRSTDVYPYEEERRLFYVALTRTKNEIYLLVNKKSKSIFIKEIIKDSNEYIEYI